MYILGISCFYHDAAICLLKDGVPIAATDEQSFSERSTIPVFRNSRLLGRSSSPVSQ